MTLVQGDFDKGSKTTAKNVEVTVSVYDEDGKRLEVSLFCSVSSIQFKFSFAHVCLGSAAGSEVFLIGCVISSVVMYVGDSLLLSCLPLYLGGPGYQPVSGHPVDFVHSLCPVLERVLISWHNPTCLANTVVGQRLLLSIFKR